MQTEIIYGILIPFIGTTAGAACVFFLRCSIDDRIYKSNSYIYE